VNAADGRQARRRRRHLQIFFHLYLLNRRTRSRLILFMLSRYISIGVYSHELPSCWKDNMLVTSEGSDCAVCEWGRSSSILVCNRPQRIPILQRSVGTAGRGRETSRTGPSRTRTRRSSAHSSYPLYPPYICRCPGTQSPPVKAPDNRRHALTIPCQAIDENAVPDILRSRCARLKNDVIVFHSFADDASRECARRTTRLI
jgi:hypothetical protein